MGAPPKTAPRSSTRSRRPPTIRSPSSWTGSGPNLNLSLTRAGLTIPSTPTAKVITTRPRAGRGRRARHGAVGETSRRCVYAALKRLGRAHRRRGAVVGLWESRRAPRCRRLRDGDLRRDVAPRSVHVVLERSRRARTSTAWRYPRPPASSAALEPLESHRIPWPADADPRSARPRHLLSPRPQNDASGAARHLSWASGCRRASEVTRTVGRSAPTQNRPGRATRRLQGPATNVMARPSPLRRAWGGRRAVKVM